LELAAIPLNALPKAVITVIAPPWDQPPWYGRAIIDLRDPLPAEGDVASTEATLSAATDAAIMDAQSRLKLQITDFMVIDAFGVMRWPDNSLGCPGVTPSSHLATAGYLLFLVRGGTASSRELEYHSDGSRTLFCGFSR
jgi:hypothetical protein